MTLMTSIEREFIFTTGHIPTGMNIKEAYGFISHQDISKIDIVDTEFPEHQERFSLHHQSYDHVDYILTKFLQRANENANAIIGFNMTSSIFHKGNDTFMLITYTGNPVRIE